MPHVESNDVLAYIHHRCVKLESQLAPHLHAGPLPDSSLLQAPADDFPKHAFSRSNRTRVLYPGRDGDRSTTQGNGAVAAQVAWLVTQ